MLFRINLLKIKIANVIKFCTVAEFYVYYLHYGCVLIKLHVAVEFFGPEKKNMKSVIICLNGMCIIIALGLKEEKSL